MTSSSFPLYAVSITPFDASGWIDEEGLHGHLRRLAGAGCIPYLAGSGSGEANGLSSDERRQVFAIARDALGAEIPLRYAAFEPRTSGELIQAVRSVADFGLDAVRLTVPDLGHGHMPTAAEAEGFLRETLSALDVSVTLAVGKEGLRSTPSTGLVKALIAENPHIVSIEIGTADPSVFIAYRDVAGNLPVLVPTAGPLLSVLALGATGTYGPLLNLLPHTHRHLFAACQAGDFAKVKQAFRTIVAVQALLHPYGTVIPIKAALSAFGLPAGRPRAPRLTLGAEETAVIVNGLIALGVPDAEGWNSGILGEPA
ncbi:dihydrodipicolinate synthase family protein [Brucella pituitosa]|uniref:dihydrodipicolinate synthase family protein n=1 Tax=Brucella pituitosa TaxID=571256 RepID=UPI000CFF1F56|nr:hypothetical protein CQ062_20205 [Ochrobactrum sp. MYb68]